ncbi:hypothetical protein DFH27DRAFT_82500 [Peziza echinospora]|nr:hypothetical protein DFH27DRAFT_82500 [Peziza echinospora]
MIYLLRVVFVVGFFFLYGFFYFMICKLFFFFCSLISAFTSFFAPSSSLSFARTSLYSISFIASSTFPTATSAYNPVSQPVIFEFEFIHSPYVFQTISILPFSPFCHRALRHDV